MVDNADKAESSTTHTSSDTYTYASDTHSNTHTSDIYITDTYTTTDTYTSDTHSDTAGL